MTKDQCIKGITQAQRALQLNPRSARHYFDLMNGLNMLGKHQEALKVSLHACQNVPQNYSIQALTIRTMLFSGDIEQAWRRVHLLLRVLGDHWQICQAAAEVARWKGDISTAITWQKKALHKVLNLSDRANPTINKVEFDTQLAEKLLWQTLHNCYHSGLQVYPLAGSLLGLEREGRLLGFDKDLDVGVNYRDIPRVMKLLIQQGWWEESASFGMRNPRSMRHASGVTLDICGFYTPTESCVSIGGFWSKGLQRRDQRITLYPRIDLVTKQTPVGKVWYMAHPHKWLAALYGENWPIPDPSFDSVVGARNLYQFSGLTQFYLYAHLLEYWRQGRMNKVAATLHAGLTYLADDPLLNSVKQAWQASVKKA